MKLKVLLGICIIVIIAFIGTDIYALTQGAQPAEALVEEENKVCGTGEGCSISDKRTKGFNVGNQIPNITLKDFDGSETNLYDMLEGKDKFVLSFAVDWCSDCQRQDEKMKQYYDTLPDDYGFAAVFVDFSSAAGDKTTSKEQTEEFLEKENYPFPTFWDYDNSLSANFGGIKATPTNFLLDENGIIKIKSEEVDADILLLPNEDKMYIDDFSSLDKGEE